MNPKELLQSADETYITSVENNKAYCVVSDKRVYIGGRYYLYEHHRLKRREGKIAVPLKDVMRVGITKTYSRLMLLVPMLFGVLALLIKAIPSIGIQISFVDIPILEDILAWSYTFWSLPYQDTMWYLCAALCFLTIPLYWLSYRKLLEINTTQGRYCLSCKGISKAVIDKFGERVAVLKNYTLK